MSFGRILAAKAVYPSPLVGPPNLNGSTTTQLYEVGSGGVKNIEDAGSGCVLVTGTHATVRVPFAWTRHGEPVAAVQTTEAAPVAPPKRGKR